MTGTFQILARDSKTVARLGRLHTAQHTPSGWTAWSTLPFD